MIKTKKQMYLVIASFALVLLLGTTTYAFFNYTRTGARNAIKTGRIYFNSEQGTSINLTNLFPIDIEEEGIMDDTTKVGTVTINVEGDTTYTDGIEYKVSAVNVQNSVGSKSLPISIQVSVENNSSNDPATSLGTSDDDYFTNRGASVSTSIYKVLAKSVIKNNKELVVGYIKSGQEGVDGNIVIKAYIDKNKIAISDTYPENTVWEVVENFDVTACESALIDKNPDDNYVEYCESAVALQSILNTLPDDKFNKLITAGIIKEKYTNGTPASFGEGRTILTTEEWNSLQTNGVSFQVKVEANEGIWVEEPAPTIDSCPDCKFMYNVVNPTDPTTFKWTTWNNQGQTPSQITTGLYDNYEELIETTGKNYFLGVKLNSNNEATNAYACGVKDNIPFCIEGTNDLEIIRANIELLQSEDLWNNTCVARGDYSQCGPDSNNFASFISFDGAAVGLSSDGSNITSACSVANGSFGCFNLNP